MKKFEFALALLSICTLASCNTIVGMGEDVKDTVEWAHYRPSTAQKVIGEAPSGYREQPPKTVAPLETESPSTSDDETDNESQAESPPPAVIARSARHVSLRGNKLVWNKIENYNAENPALPDGVTAQPALHPQKAAGEPIVQYSRNVLVFPVNGDISPYTQVNSVQGGFAGGELVQQVFFAHGSAQVGKIDRKNLRELAQSLVHNTGDYKLDVVGHASRRVNRVRDPLQKKMINFKMAQKRANAVAGVLLKAGLSPAWVVATSMGDEQPNPHRNGKTQEAADRRAEVFLSTN